MDFKRVLNTIALFRGAVSLEDEDRSLRYYDNFAEWTNELKSNIALFGHCEAAERLVKQFPDSFNAIVDLDPAKKGSTVGRVPIVSFEEYVRLQAGSIIITDVRLQYEYLDLIYQGILAPHGLATVDGIEKIIVRYNYELKGIAYGNEPGLFDQDYLRITKSLPMECTIPVDSIIRVMDFVKTSMAMEGDILEIGTGLGGSTYYMASVIEALNSPKKQFYSIDKFKNEYYIPDLNYNTTAKNLSRFPFLTLIEGYAPEALLGYNIEKIAFCFMDCYAFPSIMEYVYQRVVPGGAILIDNYNHGCFHNHGRPLADLFFYDKPEKIVRVGGSQGLVVKQAPGLAHDILTLDANRSVIEGPPNVRSQAGISDSALIGLDHRATISVRSLTGTVANNAILESMACGLPIVASDLPAVREYTTSSGCCYTGPGDADDVVENILSPNDAKPELAAKGTANHVHARRNACRLVGEKLMEVHNIL
jgi:hypothetical protein